MRIIAWLAGISTLVAAAAYTIVSLNRWEWNRALFFGLVVLIAEVGLATGLVLRRLARLERASRDVLDPMLREILRVNRPPQRDRFSWLKESPSQMNVFVTFLVGGGIVVSAAAWLIDRLAARTATPVGEDRLARRLGRISYPRGGLLVDDVTALAQDVPGADDRQIRQLLRSAVRR
ncbi:MAG TPA: hypothetical protein VFZ79_02060 [Acidimicrobiales bacterium]